ncbi:MAG: hypothetical protein QNL61_10980 [Crocinitomicaceae bacterium]
MKQVLIILAMVIVTFSHSQELTPQDKTATSNFIEALKVKDLKKLMPFIAFPIKREYPLPDIKNEAELIYRCNEHFDDSITNIISNSNIDKEWSRVSWRGFMLNSRSVWIQDADYKLITVNVQSKAEKEKLKTIINYDKVSLNASIKEFDAPVIVLKTEKFYIRIDELKDELYRYAVWSINSPLISKPDLVISNGTIEYMLSGGNHQYKFNNGEYKYQISQLATAETDPSNLIVEKNGAEILFAPAEIIRN